MQLVEFLFRATEGGADNAAVRAAAELLDRLAAKPRPQTELVSVPGMAEATTLQGKMDAVIAAVADRQVSADAGDRLIRMLHSYGRARSFDLLERRIAELERQLGIDNPVHGEIVDQEQERSNGIA